MGVYERSDSDMEETKKHCCCCVDTPEADEVYIREWALNTAAVTRAGRNVFYVWKQEE